MSLRIGHQPGDPTSPPPWPLPPTGPNVALLQPPPSNPVPPFPPTPPPPPRGVRLSLTRTLPSPLHGGAALGTRGPLQSRATHSARLISAARRLLSLLRARGLPAATHGG